MTNEKELKKSAERIKGILLRVNEQQGGSHGEMAIANLFDAIIKAGLTTAACGALDSQLNADAKAVLADPKTLNKVARAYWWGETDE